MDTMILKVRTSPLRLLNVKREPVIVDRWYPIGADFIIHRSIENPGWTITHTRSRLAIIQKIRTRGQAFKLLDELKVLTDKWHILDSQGSLKIHMNHRERGAILDLVLKVQASREWSFR